MKTLKMICMAVVLVSALTIPGSAGELNSPGFTGDPGTPVTQPTPQPEDDTLVTTSSLQSDASGAELMAILLTLSALF